VPTVEAVAAAHQRQQSLIARAAAGAAQSLWRLVDPADLDGSFAAVLPRLVAAVTAGQYAAADAADDYLTAAGAAQGVDMAGSAAVAPEAFAGRAADGRDLASLLQQAVIESKIGIAGGMPVRDAQLRGLNALVTATGNEVQQAGRNADHVAVTGAPAMRGYTRKLTLPSCSRCAILAGRVYPWSSGFRRHPACDCVHVGYADRGDAVDLATDPRAAILDGRVTGLSRAEAQAIRDGADPSQVVNAHRGTYTFDVAGTEVRSTRAGTSVREGRAGRRMALSTGELRGRNLGQVDRAAQARLTVGQIYKMGGTDRARVLDMLHRYGYLADPSDATFRRTMRQLSTDVAGLPRFTR